MTNSSPQIIVVTHGELACALVRTMELITGPQADVFCLALSAGEDAQELESRLEVILAHGKPTLILVDMLGGTPWNVALGLATHYAQVKVVSGANLPMLLEVALSRNGMPIDQLARLALETGAGAVQIGSFSRAQ